MIDVLERLIPVLNKVNEYLNNEVLIYNTQKPAIDQSLSTTSTSRWYANLENLTEEEMNSYILRFDEESKNRKEELTRLLSASNPQENLKSLTAFKERISSYEKQFENVEMFFNESSVADFKRLRTNFESTKKAYDVLTNELDELNILDGFGSNPWRILWDAAQNFAHSNGLSDGKNFPSANSLKKCVLCQQDLDESAQKRMLSFNKFISHDISTHIKNLTLILLILNNG